MDRKEIVTHNARVRAKAKNVLSFCFRFLLNIMKWVAPLEDDLSPLEYYFSRVAKMLPIIHTMLNPIIYRYPSILTIHTNFF